MHGRVVVRDSQPADCPAQGGKTEFEEGVGEWKEGLKKRVCVWWACVVVFWKTIITHILLEPHIS